LLHIKKGTATQNKNAKTISLKKIKGLGDMNNIKKKNIFRRIPRAVLCALLVFTLLAGATFTSAAAERGRYEGIKLIAGGTPFGIKFSTEGVVVIGFCDLDGLQKTQNPAYLAGLRPKDVIIKVDGKSIKGATELTEAVEGCGGRELSFTYKRGGSETTVRLTPAFSASDGKYKTGIWVRDSGAGIGTVTYIDPRNGNFGGLGHGICDGETGELIPIDCGVVTEVKVSSVKKGIAGEPGEIKGHFGTKQTGELAKNTDCGVFGRMDEIPAGLGGAMPIADRSEVKGGEATVLCTFDDGIRQSYKIEIANVNRDAKGSKCFIIKVTDPKLVEKTGGIVQGMSGSPIIQNGKLVGAVTHVMINDPTVGYGIFIENMLDQMGDLAL